MILPLVLTKTAGNVTKTDILLTKVQWKVLNYVQCKEYCAELENGLAGIYALCVPNCIDCATDKESFSIALLSHCLKQHLKRRKTDARMSPFICHDEGIR